MLYTKHMQPLIARCDAGGVSACDTRNRAHGSNDHGTLASNADTRIVNQLEQVDSKL